MKKLKKGLAIVLVMVMFSGMNVFAADFEDVIGTPCEEAVAVLASMGVIAGYDTGGKLLFQPDQIVTRAEMAAFIVRERGLSAPNTKTKFIDVPEEFWGSGAIAAANSKGIIVGYGDQTFEQGSDEGYCHLQVF